MIEMYLGFRMYETWVVEIMGHIVKNHQRFAIIYKTCCDTLKPLNRDQ
jgi:hypothetical protein